MRKKVSACVLAIGLLLCMAVSAFANVPTVNLSNKGYELIMQAASIHPSGVPSDYKYVAVFLDGRTAGDSDNPYIYLIWFNSPILKKNDRVYRTDRISASSYISNPAHYYTPLNAYYYGFQTSGSNLNLHMPSGFVVRYYMQDCSTLDFDDLDTVSANMGYDLRLSLAPPPLPSTAELESVLNQAKGIDDTGYTFLSWNRLQTAIYEGDELLKKTVYTESEVVVATDNLRKGIDGLEVAAVPTEPSDFEYLIDGIRPVDLLPAEDAIFQNIFESRRFGLYVFAVLVCIVAMLKVIRKFIRSSSFYNFDHDSRLR